MTGRLTGTVWRRSIVAYLLKDRFPRPAVYGPSSRRQLRLIICGGVFDR